MEETKSINTKYLLVIGLVVVACLVILTLISLLDLRRDMTTPTNQQSATILTANPQNISVCPNCGAQGIPRCFYCGSLMNWDNIRGRYSCPQCKRFGPATCPYCRNAMVQRTPQLNQSPRTNVGTPFQTPANNQGGTLVVGNGCATCPSLPLCQPVALNQGTVWFRCPGCSYRLFCQSNAVNAGVKCPRCNTAMVRE